MNRVTAVIGVFALSLLISACNNNDGQAPQTGASDPASQVGSTLDRIGEQGEAAREWGEETLSDLKTEGKEALSDIDSKTRDTLSDISAGIEEGAEKAADELGIGEQK